MILVTIIFLSTIISNSECFPSRRYLYIDLGTNDGSSIDAFLPTKSSFGTNIASDGSYAAEKGGISFFMPATTKSDPMYNKSNYEIYAVEANPVFTAKLLEQKERYDGSHISKSYTL